VGGYTKCTGHGGGRRCKHEGCTKSAQSSTDYCVRHGGGKKCTVPGCGKVARGRNNLCVGHTSADDQAAAVAAQKKQLAQAQINIQAQLNAQAREYAKHEQEVLLGLAGRK
jgi:hypothetical protein